MGTPERLDEDLKTAMKSKDELRVQVLRMIKSDLRYKKIELGRELTDDDVIGVLSSGVKKRRDSIEEYRRGGREDLASSEAAEIAIIQGYLPEQLSDEELTALVDKAVTQTGARTIKDMGAIMKILMPDVRGRADGKAVNAAVRARLEGK
ncbi:MAG: glutamyl-tRNA amidotransferase [candidate division Zixibacteria bacterium RBG_16_53_22]|nr:MAG: glutamyl-tRNA amidotransferase [candidate division Zixibacteria bacterium RBG_16_53_22]